MPELPEVETMCRGIAGVVGARLTALTAARCRRQPISIVPRLASVRRRTVGRRVEAVERVGKRVVLAFDSGDRLVIEPRMTGLVLVADPPSREHLRLRLAFAGGTVREVWFWDRRGLGVVRLVDPRQFDKLYGPAKLGPDALAIGADELAERLADSRRAIKVALLDQRALAGVGNLYAAEILHAAGIHPELPCRRLRPAQWQRLHAALARVLRAAIRHEGSTLADGTYRNVLAQSGGYQNHHRVYDRAGQPCLACGTPIRRLVQAQRSTFYCPRCQGRQVRP